MWNNAPKWLLIGSFTRGIGSTTPFTVSSWSALPPSYIYSKIPIHSILIKSIRLACNENFW